MGASAQHRLLKDGLKMWLVVILDSSWCMPELQKIFLGASVVQTGKSTRCEELIPGAHDITIGKICLTVIQGLRAVKN